MTVTGARISEMLTEAETEEGPMRLFRATPENPTGTATAILYMDVFGLREELFEMARAYARAGYRAVVPDLFHRRDRSVFDPVNDRGASLPPEVFAANVETTLDMSVADTRAVIAHLDAGAAVQSPLVGIGYCMGGRHALAAASHLRRVGAGISAHGGRLVTDRTDSPHRLIDQLEVPFAFYCARDDDTCPDEHILLLAERAAGLPAVTVETLNAHHGWSFPGRWSHAPEAAAIVHRRALSMLEAAGDPAPVS